jgi:hypothetical protein
VLFSRVFANQNLGLFTLSLEGLVSFQLASPFVPSATHCSLIAAHLPPKLFRINTCKSLSKQTTLTPFRTYTYNKTGGRGVLWLTRFLLSSNVPTRFQPSFVFNRFHTLPSSVSCKSFACHFYENCRVYTNSSHFGTSLLPERTRFRSESQKEAATAVPRRAREGEVAMRFHPCQTGPRGARSCQFRRGGSEPV